MRHEKQPNKNIILVRRLTPHTHGESRTGDSWKTDCHQKNDGHKRSPIGYSLLTFSAHLPGVSRNAVLMQRLVAWLQHGMREAVVEIIRECQCVHRDSVNKIMESEVQRLKINPAQQVFMCDQNVNDLGNPVPLCVDTGWQVTHERLHNSTGLEITQKVRKVLYCAHSFTFLHESFMCLTHGDLPGRLLHCKETSLNRGGSDTERLETPQLQMLHRD